MVDFAKLRAKSGKAGLEEITKKLAKKTYESDKDERFWFPKADAAGNGFAIIRFLPDNSEDLQEYIKIYEHAFQYPSKTEGGRWYIEKNLKTVGKPDPVGEYINMLWNTGLESNKTIARNIKINNRAISNILVISDKEQPECEGKVYLYKYGTKILGKILESINPTVPGEVPMNPFDVYEGGDFKLVMKRTKEGPNYDNSKFSPPSQVAKNDKELEKILNQTYELNEFTNPDNFKTYEQLKKRFHYVMRFENAERNEEVSESLPQTTSPVAKTKKAAKIPEMVDNDDVPFDTGEDNSDDMDFLNNLVDDD